MTICQFYLRGNCKFGSSCKFEHSGPSAGGGSAPTGFGRNRTEKDLVSKTPAEVLKSDLTDERPIYKWSCYAFNNRGNVVEGTDLSPEEMRWAFMKELKETGQVGSSIKMTNELQGKIDTEIQGIMKNAGWVLASGPLVRPTPSSFGSTTISAFGATPTFGTAPSFGGAANTSSFGSNGFSQPAGSAFGQSSFDHQSSSNQAFGKTGFGTTHQSAFGSTTTFQQSAFGTHSSTQPSSFGSTTTFQQSAFGSSANSQPSAFRSTANTQPSAFGSTANTQQSAFGSSANTEQSAFGLSSNSQQSAFGSAAISTISPQQSSFGPTSTTSAFGNINTMRSSNVRAFGSNGQAFGNITQTQTSSVFGSAPNSNNVASTISNTPFSSIFQNTVPSNQTQSSSRLGGISTNTANTLIHPSSASNETNLSLIPITMTKEQVEAAFASQRFQFGLIPEVPPSIPK